MGVFDISSVRFVPEISRIELNGIGVWKEERLLLGSGLNLITGRSGTGKTTILNAIAAVFYGVLYPGYLKGHKNSQIRATTRHEGSIILKPVRKKLPVRFKCRESISERRMRILPAIIAAAPIGYAILFDEDIFGVTSDDVFRKAIEMLHQSSHQVIVATNRMIKIPEVWIFECLLNPKTKFSKIHQFIYRGYDDEEEED